MKTMIIYCVFSKESILKMGGNRGKLAAQAGHAYLHSYWNAMEFFPENCILYRGGLARKVCLVCDTDRELLDILNKLEGAYPTTKVIDKGLTVFNEPTLTCIGIGPVAKEDVSETLGTLRVLI